MSRQGHISSNLQTEAKSGTTLGWALALTVAVIFAALLVTYKPHQLPQNQLSAQNSSTASAQMDGDDQQLVAQVSDPDARSAYETSLREANAYIADAQAEAQRDPDDPAAQELLQDAYQQKEMLYQMAVARSLP